MDIKRGYSYDFYIYIQNLRSDCLKRLVDVVNMIVDKKYLDFTIDDLQALIKEFKDLKMYDFYLFEHHIEHFNYLKKLEKEKKEIMKNEK